MWRKKSEAGLVMTAVLVITSIMAIHDQSLFSLTESCLDKNSADTVSGVRSEGECIMKCKESKCAEAVYEKMTKRCYLSDKISALCSTPTWVFRDISRYQADGYAELLTSDYSIVGTEQGHCLSLCAVNQTCAAVSHDETTCFMSGVPIFLNNSDVETKAFLKEAHKENLEVIQFRTDLTKGGSTQSSPTVNANYPSSFAIDGRYFYQSGDGVEHDYLFATAVEQLPWLKIDLVSTFYIVGVKLWNRKLSPEQTIQNAQVHVANGVEHCSTFPEETRCGEWPGRPTENPVLFECVKTMMGNCVKLTGHEQCLAIREVEVHGWGTF